MAAEAYFTEGVPSNRLRASEPASPQGRAFPCQRGGLAKDGLAGAAGYHPQTGTHTDTSYGTCTQRVTGTRSLTTCCSVR